MNNKSDGSTQDEEKIKLKGEVSSAQFTVIFPTAYRPYTVLHSLVHPPSLFLLCVTHFPTQVHRLIAPRDQKHQSNFVEFRASKIVYRRYAGLFFCVCVDANDNELAYLESIHFFVEVLDSFFGNVCELDLVFNFYKVGNDPVDREN